MSELSAPVLGKLLIMQAILGTLPDEQSIFGFVCRGLIDMPGVVEVHLSDPPEEPSDVSIVRFPMLIGNSRRLVLSIKICDPSAFAPYKDYLANFCFVLTVILDERTQRHLIELDQARLEERIEERTKELRESEARLKRTQEIAHLGSWELDVVNNILTWSDEVFRIFGLQPREFGATYEAFLELVHPDDRVAVDAAFSSSLREGRDSYEIDHRFVRRITGEIRYVHERCEHVRDETGRVIRSVGMVHDITERKLAEEALSASEAHYRSLFDSSLIGVALTDRNFIFTETNEAFCNMLGYSKEELIGKMGVADVSDPDDAEKSIEMAKKLIRHEIDHYSFEKRYVSKAGKVIAALLFVKSLHNQDGEYIGAMGSILDITERKQSEERLFNLTQRLDLATSAARLGVWDWNVRDNQLIWNDRMFDLYGITPDTFSGNIDAWKNGLHPDDKDTALSEFQAALNGDKELDTIFRVRHPDGAVRYVKANGLVVWGIDGTAERMLGINADITELKHAEQLLRESEEKYRNLFNNAEVGIFRSKLDGSETLDVNRKFLEIVGRTRDETLGKPSAMLWEDPREREEMIRRLVADGRVSGFEYKLLNPQRGTRNCLTSLVLYREQEILEGSILDITERRRVEDALQKLNVELEMRVAERTEELEEIRVVLEKQNAELQEAYHGLEEETATRIRTMEELREKDRMMIQQSRMAAMGEMLGNIAHQWRQPLNILGIMVQNLGMSLECGEFSKELLDASIGKAMEIVLHLSQTIDDFSNFATPDKEKSLFSVDKIIVKTISMVEESFKHMGIAIETETTGDSQINGYANEYAQVLLNILMNARDALLGQKTANAQITVRSWSEGERTVVAITDNAGGIKEDILGKIFDAYFTTKDLGKGTGVGLFMSKIIIEKNMGGRLTVRNTGDGAEFRIEV